MIGQGANGFVGNKDIKVDDIDKALNEPTDNRIFVISKAMQAGYTVDQIHALTKIDKWFLNKLMGIVSTHKEMRTYDNCEQMPLDLLKKAKVQGFSDVQIANALYKGMDSEDAEDIVRAFRKAHGIVPCVKQIDNGICITHLQAV